MGVRSEAEHVAREGRRVVRESWREVRDENVTFMAGSIAYHAFVSMLPLLLFLLVVLTTVGTESFVASLAELTAPFLTPYARRLLVESIDVATARTGVSVVGAVTLLWGMSKIFRGLDVAFSRIYGTASNKHLFAQFENAVVVFVALGIATVAFFVAGAAATLFPDLPYPTVLNPLFLVVGLAIAFFPIYYVFPDVDVTPLEVLPGVAVAAVGWAALEGLFQNYVAIAGRYEAVYGALGSAFILLIWLYFGGLVLLVGGVVNAVLAGRTRDEHALHVTEEVSADPRPEGGPPDERARLRTASTGPAHAGFDGTKSEGGRPNGTRSDGAKLDGTRPDGAESESASDDAPVRADRRLDAGADHYDDVERLVAEIERLREENQRLREENQRLGRRIDVLNRRLWRRRSVWKRAKRWLFDE